MEVELKADFIVCEFVYEIYMLVPKYSVNYVDYYIKVSSRYTEFVFDFTIYSLVTASSYVIKVAILISLILYKLLLIGNNIILDVDNG